MLNLRAFQVLALLGILASLALVFGLVMLTCHMDAVQQDRDFRLVSSQLKFALDSSLQNIATVAASDEAIQRLDHARDTGWGSRTFPEPASSQVFVYTIAFDDSIISGLHDGKDRNSGLFTLEAELPRLISGLRRNRWGGASSADAAHEARPVQTFLWLNSQLYILIGAPFSPSTPTLQLMHSRPPLLVLIMPMDVYLQNNLADTTFYKFRLVPGTFGKAVDGVSLSDAAGHVVASLEWDLAAPGRELRHFLLAPLLLLVSAFAALVYYTYCRGIMTARQLVASEARAHYLAYHDELTALANRRKFIAELERAVALAVESNVPLSVLLIDLDRFKNVNDTYGHQCGDELIRKVANRLSELCPVGDLCARLGGDEFIILTRGHNETETIMFGNLIVKSLSLPVQLSIATVTIGGSVGISIFRGCGDGEGLMREADLALYRVKAHGKGSAACFYQDSFLKQVQPH